MPSICTASASRPDVSFVTPYIGDEESHPCRDVAAVDRERVADRQLLDRQVALDAVEPALESVDGHWLGSFQYRSRSSRL